MAKIYWIAPHILRILFVIFVLLRPSFAETAQDTAEKIFKDALSVNDLSVNLGDNNVIVSINNCVVTIDQAYKDNTRLHSSVKINFNELLTYSLEEREYPHGYEISIHGDAGSVEISGTDGEHGSYNTMIITYDEKSGGIFDVMKYFTSKICTGKH